MTQDAALFEPPAPANRSTPRLDVLRRTISEHPVPARYRPGLALLEAAFEALDLAIERRDYAQAGSLISRCHRLAADFQYVPDPDTPLPLGTESESQSDEFADLADPE